MSDEKEQSVLEVLEEGAQEVPPLMYFLSIHYTAGLT